MIEQLAPLGDHQGEGCLALPGSVHQETHESRRRKGAAVRRTPHGVDAIAILRRQEAVKGHLGSAPSGSPLVVASAVVSAIPLRRGHAGRRIPGGTQTFQGGPPQRDSLRVGLPSKLIDLLEAAEIGNEADRRRRTGRRDPGAPGSTPWTVILPPPQAPTVWMLPTWLRSNFEFECRQFRPPPSIYKTLDCSSCKTQQLPGVGGNEFAPRWLQIGIHRQIKASCVACY